MHKRGNCLDAMPNRAQPEAAIAAVAAIHGAATRADALVFGRMKVWD